MGSVWLDALDGSSYLADMDLGKQLGYGFA